MKNVMALITILVLVVATGCVDKEDKKPVYSTGYKSFKATQDQYREKKSSFSARARALYDSLSPSLAEIDYSKPMDCNDVYLACFGLDKESMTDEYFALLYEKDVEDLTPQEVREVTLYVRYSNTKVRIKDPFFTELSLHYGFDSPEDFYRFGEYLASYVPYSDEKSERIEFSLEELHDMYRNGTMVFPSSDCPVEDMVRKEMKDMPKILKSKSSGFTFKEAVEIQNWMRGKLPGTGSHSASADCNGRKRTCNQLRQPL